MQEVLKTIAARSSTRAYTDEKLTKDELDALLEAGLQAPTATNRQELHFTVVDGGSPVLDELQSELTGGRPGGFYYGAPTVIFISGETAFHWTAVDAGIAVENIAIAAQALGLGSVIIGCVRKVLLGEKRDHYAQALKFPEGYDYQIAIAVGHKAADKEPHTYDRAKDVTVL